LPQSKSTPVSGLISGGPPLHGFTSMPANFDTNTASKTQIRYGDEKIQPERVELQKKGMKCVKEYVYANISCEKGCYTFY